MVRVTFGIIVLNGQPFLEYNLHALYPFAHQIIVVEGATEAAASLATADGHSTDGTLEVLRRFKAEHDPDGKVVLVTGGSSGLGRVIDLRMTEAIQDPQDPRGIAPRSDHTAVRGGRTSLGS